MALDLGISSFCAEGAYFDPVKVEVQPKVLFKEDLEFRLENLRPFSHFFEVEKHKKMKNQESLSDLKYIFWKCFTIGNDSNLSRKSIPNVISNDISD